MDAVYPIEKVATMAQNKKAKLQHAIMISADGFLTVTQECDGELKTLQAAVGGYIEVVRVSKESIKNFGEAINEKVCRQSGLSDVDLTGAVLIVNEDGLLKNLPINETATAIAGQVIVGDVIITKCE
jgi:hypothetical protein